VTWRLIHVRSSARVLPPSAELLDGVSTCVVWLDADGVVLHLNEPAEDLLGTSRNHAAGRALRDLVKANAELEGVISRARVAGAQYSRRDLPFDPGPGAAAES